VANNTASWATGEDKGTMRIKGHAWAIDPINAGHNTNKHPNPVQARPI
jgi:hypothetical protein